MCIIKTQQYGCGCFKDPTASIELCRAAKLVFPPAICPASTPLPVQKAPDSPHSTCTPPSYFPSAATRSHLSTAYSTSRYCSTNAPLLRTTYRPYDVSPSRTHFAYENSGSGNGNDGGGKVLEGWIQRSLWMCIDCCPVKTYVTGAEQELWRNWCGLSIGE
jgi:hypothetical protein